MWKLKDRMSGLKEHLNLDNDPNDCLAERLRKYHAEFSFAEVNEQSARDGAEHALYYHFISLCLEGKDGNQKFSSKYQIPKRIKNISVGNLTEWGQHPRTSDMDWGLQNRLSRIIKPETGRTVMLAVDHGYFLGPTSGLENPRKTITPLLPFADSLMLTRGILRTSVDPQFPIPVILRVSGGTSILKELSNEKITTTMEDAIRLNVAAVTCSIFVGSECEKQTLMNLSKLVNEAYDYGIPVLAVTAVGKEMVRDSRYLSLSCRIAAELGAHFVKTYYCDDFEKVVESCPVPVVIAGGKKTPERDALRLTYNAVSHGAVGVDMGRNIFQSENPVAMIRAVRMVVHQKAGVDQAFDFFETQAL